MTTITRNHNDGTLLIDGTAAALRGGAYDIFFAPRSSGKALALKGTQDPVVVRYGDNMPCQKPADKSKRVHVVSWKEPANGDGFKEFFDAMETARCNFVRVFLSLATRRDGNQLLNMVPYVSGFAPNGRITYDVRGSLAGRWNDAYFERLTAFVKKADEKGVVVQLSLFNYFDLVPDERDFKASFTQFVGSPWNALNCLNRQWGAEHLIQIADGNPQGQFTSAHRTGDKLWDVQNAFVGRVMQSVSAHANVVIEVMNEPRPVATRENIMSLAEFDSSVVGMIVAHRTSLKSHALISVNATYRLDHSNPVGRSDMEMWSDRGDLPHFEEVDIVSYHGLTARTLIGLDACGVAGYKFQRVDRAAVRERATLHDERLRTKSLLYSTDAVTADPFTHEYPGDLQMRTRDGQINCGPGANATQAEELTKTHVGHWARKCLELNAGALKGKYHFQNQSTFDAAMLKTGQAATELGL